MKGKVENSMGAVILLAILFFGGGLCSIANAYLVQIGVEGVVKTLQDSAGHLQGQIHGGTPITGYYAYESTTTDSNPSENVGLYWNYGLNTGLILHIGGLTFQSLDPIDFLLGVSNDNPSNCDVYWIRSNNNANLLEGLEIEDILWQIEDIEAMELNSDVLPLVPPMLNNWEENVLSIRGGPRESEFFFNGTITRVWMIPEPCSIVLLLAGSMLLRKNSKH